METLSSFFWACDKEILAQLVPIFDAADDDDIAARFNLIALLSELDEDGFATSLVMHSDGRAREYDEDEGLDGAMERLLAGCLPIAVPASAASSAAFTGASRRSGGGGGGGGGGRVSSNAGGGGFSGSSRASGGSGRSRNLAGAGFSAAAAADIVRRLFVPSPLASAAAAGGAGAPAPLALSATALALLSSLPCECGGAARGPGDARAAASSASAATTWHSRACLQARYSGARELSEDLRAKRDNLLRRACGSVSAPRATSGGVRAFYIQEASAVSSRMRAADEAASHALFLLQNAGAVSIQPAAAARAPRGTAAAAAPPPPLASVVIGGPDATRELFPSLGSGRVRAPPPPPAAASASLRARAVVEVDLHGQHAAEAVALLRDFVLPHCRATGCAELRVLTGQGRGGGGAPMKAAVGGLLRALAEDPAASGVARVVAAAAGFSVLFLQ